jgi:glyoxylase I family protein
MGFERLGVEHIALQVRDQDAAQKFYIGILGCEIYRINPEVPLIQMRFGEHLIDLLPGNGSPETTRKEGIHHFCLSIRCDDMQKLAEELVAKGAKMQGEVRSQHGAYGISQSLYLEDPDGYIVELKMR